MSGAPPEHRRSAGRRAEATAVAWLEEREWTIVARNFHVRGGEIDLIAVHGDVLAFVEVRSRRSHTWGSPEATIGARKIRRIVNAARHWLARNGDGGKAIRFDVLALTGPPDRPEEVRHFPGAFDAGM